MLGLIRTTAGDVKSRAYAKEWSRIESALGRDAFGDLFGHIRTIYAKQKQRATLVKEFQEHVTEYKAPHRPRRQGHQALRRSVGLRARRRLRGHRARRDDQRSPVLAQPRGLQDWVPRRWCISSASGKTQTAAEFFQSLERLTYFLLVTKVGINERIETYARSPRKSSRTLQGRLAELTTLALTDAQKRKFVAALDGDVYDDLPKARMALVLRLESLVRAPGVQLQNAVSLEHVLPQTPPDGSDWLQWFPDKDERDGWTHRLANLVPLDRNKNSSASNYNFVKKKDAYFKGKGTASPFVLTQEVRSENTWTPALLIDRQKRLVKGVERPLESCRWN